MNTQMKRSSILVALLAASSMLYVALSAADQPGSADIKAVENWQFSEMKGSNVYYASNIDPANRNNMSEDERARVRRAMTDNSSMPILRNPVSLEDSISNKADVAIAWTRDSKTASENPAGIAVIKFTDGLGENVSQYIVWRGDYTTSLVSVGTKSTVIYTIHHNVSHPNGGFLLTYTTIRNSILGVNTYTMSGSAKLVK